MFNPQLDPRYMTADGCIELAREMERLARSAQLLADRHKGWAKALRARGNRLDKADTLELEARAERMQADAANPQYREDAFDFPAIIESMMRRG